MRGTGLRDANPGVSVRVCPDAFVESRRAADSGATAVRRTVYSRPLRCSPRLQHSTCGLCLHQRLVAEQINRRSFLCQRRVALLVLFTAFSNAYTRQSNRYLDTMLQRLKERTRLSLNRLLPPVVNTLESQVTSAYGQDRRLPNALGTNIYLTALHDHHERSFSTCSGNTRANTEYQSRFLPGVAAGAF